MPNILWTRGPALGVAIGLMAFAGPWDVAGDAAAADPLPAADAGALKTALKAIDGRKWKQAGRLGARIGNPLARKILRWTRLQRPDPKATFAEIADFMAKNPDWPGQTGLRRLAEEAMSQKTPDDVVLAWFNGREPLSGDGKARLGNALLAAGREAEGRATIRDAWITGNFTKRRERAFYKRHRRLLTTEDNHRRLDRLLWEGKYWPVRRMLWKAKPDFRALGVARMMLRHSRGNVDKAIAQVSDELKNHPGLVYERLRWRRRRGKDATALELLDNPPSDLVRPELWWSERVVLARRALLKGNVTEAYRIAKEHGLKDGAAFAEAEWLAGWIALRFLGDHKVAKGHFLNMFQAVKYPVSRARGAYWTARAVESLGDLELARLWYRVAAKHSSKYYGQLSVARLSPGASLKLPRIPETSGKDMDLEIAFEGHELVHAVRMLGEIGEPERLRPFILRLDGMASGPGWRLMTAKLAEASRRPDLAILVAKRAIRSGWKFPDVAFPEIVPPPMREKAGTPKLEVPLVLAVIRQESAFNVGAKSHANAQGLMQLLPRTAYKVAKRLRVPFSRRRLSVDGDYNLVLGQAYLSELLAEFKGSYVLALAAYNAGPRRVRQWIRLNGDPRDSDVDAIDWVEMIPFTETRNYIQRVLENLQVYRLRLAGTEVALRLENDLHQ